MALVCEAVQLSIYIGENDKYGHLPLYEAIVHEARAAGLAGATVLRAHVGFGRSACIRTTKILRLAQDLPIVIAIVDGEEEIEAFLPCLDRMMSGGLVTLENVRVRRYGAARHRRASRSETTAPATEQQLPPVSAGWVGSESGLV